MDRLHCSSLGRQAVVVGLVAVLWTCGLVSGQAPPDPRCDVLHGLTQDPTQCDSYLICSNQQVMRRIRCPNGQRFNSPTKQCVDAASVTCGFRPIVPACSVEPIQVTIAVNNSLATPPVDEQFNVTAPKQSLRNFLLMAAGTDPKFQFETTSVGGGGSQGQFVVTMGGTASYHNGPVHRVWVMRDTNGVAITTNIDSYEPNDGDVISFEYIEFLTA